MQKKGNISKKIKVRIYRKQIEFYSDDDYMNFVRCGVLASPVKSVEVSEKLAGLLKSAETADKTAGSGKNSDGDCSQVDLDSGAGVDLDLDAGSDPTLSADFGSVADSNLDLDLGLDLGLSLDLDLVKYSDAADSALYDGALAEAEILYKKSQESSDEFTDYAKEKLSEVYSRQKRYDDAERILSEILADDIKNGYDTMWTLEKIMLLNEQKKNHEKALKYCTEIIELLSKNPNALTQNEQTTLLICLAKRTKYEKKTVLDEGDARIFEKRLHDLYGADFADEALKEALEVYCEYLKSCGRISDACEMLLRFAKKYQLQVSLDTAHELYRSIIENEKYFIAAPELYALALIFDADTLSELDREMNYEYALRLCMKAKKIISSEWENAEAVNAIYHRVIADVYMAESYAKSEAEMQECDYLLLTEQRLLKREFEGNEFYLWKDCLEKYKQTDKHSMQKVCLDHMKECIQKSKDKSGGRNICLDYYSALLEYDDEIGDTAEMSKHIDELYMEICRKECSLKADYKLCKLIEKAARLLDDMQRGNEAIFLLVMLGNIMLSEKITEEYCNVNSMSEVNREITEKVALTFVKSFNDAQKDRKNIGSLTEIMKMTAKISEKSGEKKIADMLINAVEGYTLSEIEFKHGRYE